jgi:hypothetical protein
VLNFKSSIIRVHKLCVMGALRNFRHLNRPECLLWGDGGHQLVPDWSTAFRVTSQALLTHSSAATIFEDWALFVPQRPKPAPVRHSG